MSEPDDKAAKAAIAVTVRAISQEVEGGFGALIDVWGGCDRRREVF